MSLRLEQEVEKLTSIYVRKGGKENRLQQRARMLEFARHSAEKGATNLAQVGRGHVTTFWKGRTHLADTTLYSYWLSICELFRLAGKRGEPPKPFLKAERELRKVKRPEKG